MTPEPVRVADIPAARIATANTIDALHAWQDVAGVYHDRPTQRRLGASLAALATVALTVPGVTS